MTTGIQEDAAGASTPAISNNGTADGQLYINHLQFEDIVAIWAMRTYLQGGAAEKCMRRQFARALPATQAWIACDAVERMVETVRRHGIRPIRFHCMCHADITADEMAFLSLFHAVRCHRREEIASAAALLVAGAGMEKLAGAAELFFEAVEARHARGVWKDSSPPSTMH